MSHRVASSNTSGVTRPLARKIVLAALGIIMILVAIVAIIPLLQPLPNGNGTEDRDVVLTVSIIDTTKNYTMEELMEFPSFSGLAGFIKTAANPPIPGDIFNYTGVRVSDLLVDIGGLPENYTLEVLSSDNYAMYFSKSEVQGELAAYDSITAELIGLRNFTMVLAYEENGEPLSVEFGGPLRIAFLPTDGNYMSAGHSWSKFVTNLTIIDETPPWSLELDGVTSWNMTHDVYYSLGSCPHHRRSISQGDVVYSGVPLWTLIASMDGGQDDHFSFNSSLIASNYTVTIWSGTGENISFTSYQVAYNNSLLIAGWADDELLASPDWPLMLVTDNDFLFGNIVRIVMSDW